MEMMVIGERRKDACCNDNDQSSEYNLLGQGSDQGPLLKSCMLSNEPPGQVYLNAHDDDN